MEQEIQRMISRLHELEPGTDAYTHSLTDLWSAVQIRRELRQQSPEWPGRGKSPTTPGDTQPMEPAPEKLPAQARGREEATREALPAQARGGEEASKDALPAQARGGEEASKDALPAQAPMQGRPKGGDAAQPQLEAAFVRSELAKARRKGINVAEIVTSFGVDNFKDIPADRYPEILEKLRGAD